MNNENFDRELLDLWLPKSFKGLSKKYIMKCIFDKKIQKSWEPKIGDIIVGSTGNVFVISGSHNSCKELGGTKYFFGGFLATDGDSCELTLSMCYSMNESGKYFARNNEGKIVEKINYNHSKFSDFRYVPYPHEKNKILSFFYRTK